LFDLDGVRWMIRVPVLARVKDQDGRFFVVVWRSDGALGWICYSCFFKKAMEPERICMYGLLWHNIREGDVWSSWRV
jgi:hypothetical protein